MKRINIVNSLLRLCCLLNVLWASETAQLNLRKEKVLLEARLYEILNISAEQEEIMANALDETYLKINTFLSTCVQSPVDRQCEHPKECALRDEVGLQPVACSQSCGPEMECVDYTLCANITKGTHSCPMAQICCLKSDKLECGTRTELESFRTESTLEKSLDEPTVQLVPWTITIHAADSINPIGMGALISSNVALTTAHVVSGRKSDELVVRAGESAQGQYLPAERQVQQIVVHENFSKSKNFNIAILRLKIPFSKLPHISIICLSDPSQEVHPDSCMTTNLKTESSTASSYILETFPLSVMSSSQCNDDIKRTVRTYGRFIREFLICTEILKDTNYREIAGGSPLVCSLSKNPERYSLMGLADCTYNWECRNNSLPNIYTNVLHYVSWIQTQLEKLNVDAMCHLE